jgi:transposase-like protein
MGDYPNRVPREEQPEATPENVPDDVLDSAISIAVTYGECPECGHQQFHPIVPGHNSAWDCADCGYEMRIVG